MQPQCVPENRLPWSSTQPWLATHHAPERSASPWQVRAGPQPQSKASNAARCNFKAWSTIAGAYTLSTATFAAAQLLLRRSSPNPPRSCLPRQRPVRALPCHCATACRWAREEKVDGAALHRVREFPLQAAVAGVFRHALHGRLWGH